jgi:membrane protease YdiL (CAAX protease family)
MVFHRQPGGLAAGDHRIPPPWTQLAIFLLLLGAAFFAVLIFTAIVGVLPVDLHSAGTIKLVQAVDSILLFGIPSYFYSRLTFKERPLYHLGFRPAVRWLFYLLAVLLLATAFPFEGWLGILNRRLPLPHWMIQLEKDNDSQVTTLLKVTGPFDVFVNLLVVAVIPAIFEEMCFRGALQKIMIQLCRSPWAGIIVTAILFSAFHMQFQGFFPRMFLGILLGAAYWYSGSLWTCILAHCFFNGIQVVAATYYPKAVDENPSIPFLVVLISLLFVLGLLAGMSGMSRMSGMKGQSEEGAWH